MNIYKTIKLSCFCTCISPIGLIMPDLFDQQSSLLLADQEDDENPANQELRCQVSQILAYHGDG
ncbi:MAG: hypothetical protein K2M43_02390 [Mycoplasmoidaceae bacterium]|nr:hypothetical protein [Mycoplasmoidaceae bacterium]